MSTPREIRNLKRNILRDIPQNINNNLNTEETIDSDKSDDSFNSILNNTIEEFSNLSLIDPQSELENNTKMAKLNTDLVFKIIPEFDGNHEHLTKFLNLCNFFFKPLVNEDDKTLFVEIVKLKLVGQAEKIFKYKEIEDWKSFAAELELQFLKKESYVSLQKRLLNIKQYTNEDIRSYANRIEQLVSELNSACIVLDKDCKIESINSSYALMAFTDGLLNHDIKIILKCRENLDLKKAVELATREELSFKKPFIPFNFQNNFNQTSQNFNPGAIKKEPGAFIRKYCTNCKIPSHDTSECRRLSQSQNSTSRNSVCNFCGKFGHLSNRCYTKYFNNSKNFNGSDQYQGQTNRGTHSYAQQLPVQFTNNNSSLNQEQYQQIQENQLDPQQIQMISNQHFPNFSNQQQIDSFPKLDQVNQSFKKM